MKNLKKIVAHPLVTIFFLYFLAYGLMLINTGYYWDDWTIYNMNRDSINQTFYENASLLGAPIYSFLLNIGNSPAILFHILTFMAFFIVICLLYCTLSYLKIEKDIRFILSAIFAVLPINSARIYLICFGYSLGVLFCFIAIYFFTLVFFNKKLIFRIISLIFCILSFIINPATFVFIPAYIAFLIIISSDLSSTFFKNIQKILSNTLRYIDFVIITIAARILLVCFVKPHGFHALVNYNAISHRSIVLSPIKFMIVLLDTFVHMIDFPYSSIMICLFGLISVLVFFVLRKKKILLSNPKQFMELHLITGKIVKLSIFTIWGLYFLLAGALAFLFVGKIPSYIGYISRFQCLLGIGITLLLVDILITYINSTHLKIIFVLLVSALVTVNIDTQLQFRRAYYKQMALMTAMEKNEIIAKNRNFLVMDNIPQYNEDNPLRFYVYTGISKKIFGDETRLFLREDEARNIADDTTLKSIMFSTKDITFNGNFDYSIRIEEGELLLSYGNLCKLMMEEYFFKDKFRDDINKLLILICEPYGNSSDNILYQ